MEVKMEVDFYAELEFPGLGKIDKPIKINEPLYELQFPLATCITLGQPLLDIAEAASLNFKRYKFIQRGMYPSAWGFRDIDEHGKAVPYVKSFTVIYELGEIIV
jgi:hypothetical protein